MEINGQEINLSDLYDQKYMHREVKKGIFLSEYQIFVLKKYCIDIDNCSSINDLIFMINDILEEDDAEDLEIVANELLEFNYYANTNK